MRVAPAGPRREQLVLGLIWLGAIVGFIALVTSIDFRFRDPDSKLYSNLAIELANRPLADWIAPQWWGNWNQEGRFLPHPPGLFWIGATLIRIGAPKEQAMAIANFGYYLLTCLFAFRIGCRVADRPVGWAMAWAVILTPISLQYLIRGNLEPPLTLAIVAGMDAILRVDRSWPARIGFAAALTAAIFVKGMLGLALAGFAGLYWLVWDRGRTVLLTILGGLGVALLLAAAFEWRDRVVTGGEGFWFNYVTLQTGISYRSHSLWSKLYNLVWYLGRLAYFALPWSLVALILGLKQRGDRPGRPVADRAWRWLVASAMALIVVMALFERKADRYIFPSYTLIARAGGWIIAEPAGRVRRWLHRPSAPIAAAFAANLLLAAALKSAAARFLYSMIQAWRH